MSVDEHSLTAVFEPGMRLPEADRALAEHGFTLGHVPQSYEWATVGGCVATRSAGQASTAYGRIEDNVLALSCATPVGPLATLDVPATAAGPLLRELVTGSEGTLGVITQVALRVFPVAAAQRYEGWFFRSFAEGADALRKLAQRGAAPDVARLSDEEETRMSLGLSGGDGLKAKAGGALLRARGYADGCVLIAGWEGSAQEVDQRHAPAARLLRDAGGMAVGRSPGEAWRASRFAGPHLRDDLLDRGLLVETLETATTWTNLDALYRAVGDALRGAVEQPVVMCHISHVYATGASLYFTVFARQDANDPAGQWRAAKTAASDAIVATGGTITHHHAIGRDHVPWLGGELGDLGLELLRSVKERCDPAGVMNPGEAARPLTCRLRFEWEPRRVEPQPARGATMAQTKTDRKAAGQKAAATRQKNEAQSSATEAKQAAAEAAEALAVAAKAAAKAAHAGRQVGRQPGEGSQDRQLAGRAYWPLGRVPRISVLPGLVR